VPSQPIEPGVLTEEHIIATAQQLCKGEVRAATFCAGGGNNRVYKIDTSAGAFALKLYGAAEANKRDRLGHEFEGLRFLTQCGIGSVPGALAIDRTQRCALYEWIAGTRVTEHGIEDIRQTLDFLQALRSAGSQAGATALPAATEAVFVLSDLAEQIEARLTRLRPATHTEPDLNTFITDELLPELDRQLLRLRAWDMEAPLAPNQRILSPSDFGFHNALRRPNGSLCFIDFEYFGWDDPVKLAADFLSHPAMNLSDAERVQFHAGVARLYGDDDSFLPRLALCLPLYGIRWVLIMLNEFVPQLWARREFSGKGGDREAAKRVQLQKARAKLVSVQAYTEGQSIP
jgi:hypothetical protein